MSAKYPRCGSGKEEWKEWHWRLRHLLNEQWDPIGVCDAGGVDDEYDSYVNGITVLWQESGSDFERKLLPYLTYIEEEWMGLGPNQIRRERLDGVVAGILAFGAPPFSNR